MQNSYFHVLSLVHIKYIVWLLLIRENPHPFYSHNCSCSQFSAEDSK